MEEENRIIASIKQRILNEYRKHGSLDWAEIAARKIYRTHLVKTCNKPAVSKSEGVERKAAVCDHPRMKRIYVGDGYLKCTICGETFK
ncbi:MAG: hypothetical protein RLY43_555 [Bacteroidota bacterium]